MRCELLWSGSQRFIHQDPTSQTKTFRHKDLKLICQSEQIDNMTKITLLQI